MKLTTALLLAAATPSCAFFEQMFSGGGGNIQFQQQQQVRQPRWPKGTPQSISKEMSWLKGTEWAWGRDGWSLKLEKDGEIEAPIQQCHGGQCKWSAENGKLYLLLGDVGLHTLNTVSSKPKDMKGMKMDGNRHADRSKVNLKFEKIFDFESQDLDKDLYGALGLPDDADESQIKKVYRKLSIQYHPDKNPDEASRIKFAEIRDAYEVLNDPDKKILYDTGGMEAVKKNDKGQIEKTDDAQASVEVTLGDLYLGGEKIASLTRRIVCRGCRLRPGAPQCKGCGKCPNELKTVQVRMGPFMTQQQQEVPSKEKCMQKEASVTMVIEKGMTDGDKLTFPRMADQRPGMLPGSVVLTLKAKKDPKFTRRGNDLHMEMHVTLREALLGFTQTIRHIDGHTVEVNVKDVTKHLQVIKLKGEGMPHREDPASFGNLFVKVHVNFPQKITSDQASKIEAIFVKDPPRAEL